MTTHEDNIIPPSTFSRWQRIAWHARIMVNNGAPPAEAFEWSYDHFTPDEVSS